MIITLNLFGEVFRFALVDFILLGIAGILFHTWWRREDPFDLILDYVSNDRQRVTLTKGEITRLTVIRKFRGLILEIRSAKDVYHCDYAIYTHLEHERTAAVFAIAKEVAAAERIVLTVRENVYYYDQVKPVGSIEKLAKIEKIELRSLRKINCSI